MLNLLTKLIFYSKSITKLCRLKMFNFGGNTSSSMNLNEEMQAPEVPPSPSCASFNEQNLIGAGSWEGEICVWEPSGSNLTGRAKAKLGVPVLGLDWSGNNVALACADNNAWIWDPVSGQRKQIGAV